jgi:uncharacterized membrane protein YfcA
MIHIAAGVCLGILSAWFHHVLQLMMISVALGVCLGIVAAYMLIQAARPNRQMEPAASGQ